MRNWRWQSANGVSGATCSNSKKTSSPVSSKLTELARVRAQLEAVEAAERQRIVDKIERGEAALVPPVVIGGAPTETTHAVAKDSAGREVFSGFRTEDGRIELVSLIATGVGRAGRDDQYIARLEAGHHHKDDPAAAARYAAFAKP